MCDYKLIMRNARASSPAVQSFLYQFGRLMDPVVNVPIDGLVNNQYKSKTLPPCISLLSRSLSSDRYPLLQLNGRQTELFMPLSPEGGDVGTGLLYNCVKNMPQGNTFYKENITFADV